MHYHPFWRSHPQFCLFRKDKKCVHLLNAEVLSTGISYRYYAFLNRWRCQILTSLFIKIRSPLVTQQSEPVLGSILFLLIFVLFFALVFSPFLKSDAICGPPFIYVSVYVRAKNRSFRARNDYSGDTLDRVLPHGIISDASEAGHGYSPGSFAARKGRKMSCSVHTPKARVLDWLFRRVGEPPKTRRKLSNTKQCKKTAPAVTWPLKGLPHQWLNRRNLNCSFGG